MKRAFLLCLLLAACTPKQQAKPPLQTDGPVNPPAACQQARDRGDSC